MTVAELKRNLKQVTQVTFALPNGMLVPTYFHVIEMGKQTKNYIDCGHTVRTSQWAIFQIWTVQDYEHRLTPEKFLQIIAASKPIYENDNLEVEVEYQTDLSISKFGLSFSNSVFQLTPKHTTCLANNHCGIPAEKMNVSLADLETTNSSENATASSKSCSPDSGCC